MKGAEYEYERLANSVFVLGIVSSGSPTTLCLGASELCLQQEHLWGGALGQYMIESSALGEVKSSGLSHQELTPHL